MTKTTKQKETKAPECLDDSELDNVQGGGQPPTSLTAKADVDSESSTKLAEQFEMGLVMGKGPVPFPE